MPTPAPSLPSPATLALLLLAAASTVPGCSGDPPAASDTAASTSGDATDGETMTTSTTGSSSETGTASASATTTGSTTSTSTTEASTGEPCPAGALGCPCPSEASCDAPLVCEAGVCVPPAAGCGDGVVDDGEACDAGPGNGPGQACKADCTLNVCGDGDVGPGELCDDGNMVDDDACSNACTVATCGDGVVQEGELCDDGDADDTDACTSACTPAACGDGIVQAVTGETCDDGPGNGPGKACKGECTLNVCGDGDVGPGEACDGGEGCSDACQLDTCGDGVVDPGEACDDGNAVDHDGCTTTCSLGQVHDLTAGRVTSCVVLDGGAVRCWGSGAEGGLGYGDSQAIGDNEHPNAAGPVKLGGAAVEVEAGGRFACARLTSGDVRCWGSNGKGQLGLAHTKVIGDNEHPEVEPPVELGGKALQLSAYADHICALLDDGAVRCWGDGQHGALGLGTYHAAVGDDEHPADVPPVKLGGKAIAVSCGLAFSCALMEGGAVRCWGRNLGGQLGLGHTEFIGDNEHPADVPPVQLGGEALQVSAGQQHVCALLEGGDVRCWGMNINGAAGYPDIFYVGDDEHPASMPPVQLGGKAVAVASGGIGTCALLEGGDLRCWGPSPNGELGLGGTATIGDDEHPSAAPPVMLGGDVPKRLDLGGSHTCVFTEGGALRCWGLALTGRLGLGNTQNIGDDEHPIAVDPVKIF